MDQHKLRTLVFEKTGVKIDVDDPIFALVALNEAVLEETIGRNVARLDEACANLADHARAVASGQPAARPAPAPAAAGARAHLLSNRQLALVIAGGALIGMGLLTTVQAILRPPPPAPVIVAKELTGEQALALQNAEKLNKVISRLDARTRNAIQSEMRKP